MQTPTPTPTHDSYPSPSKQALTFHLTSLLQKHNHPSPTHRSSCRHCYCKTDTILHALWPTLSAPFVYRGCSTLQTPLCVRWSRLICVHVGVISRSVSFCANNMHMCMTDVSFLLFVCVFVCVFVSPYVWLCCAVGSDNRSDKSHAF